MGRRAGRRVSLGHRRRNQAGQNDQQYHACEPFSSEHFPPPDDLNAKLRRIPPGCRDAHFEPVWKSAPLILSDYLIKYVNYRLEARKARRPNTGGLDSNQSVAMVSISTKAFSGSLATWNVERAGGTLGKKVA